jgi:hypothetical protein
MAIPISPLQQVRRDADDASLRGHSAHLNASGEWLQSPSKYSSRTALRQDEHAPIREEGNQF